MAFTPINKHDVVATCPDGPSTSAHEEPTALGHKVATTVASTYLGRGEITKIPTVKSKKRTSTAKPLSKPKRRQTSNVNDDFRVSKGGAEVTLDAIHCDTPALAKFQGPSSKFSKMQTIASQPVSFPSSVSTTGSELASTVSKPVSFLPPRTTMDSFVTTSAPTYLQTAKAGDGQGFTLHQGSSTTATYDSTSISMFKTMNVNSNERCPSASMEQRASQDSGESGTSNRRSARRQKVVHVPSSQPEACSESSERPLIFDDYDDDKENFSDVEMVSMAESNEDEVEIRPNTPANRGRKLNTRDVDELEDYGGALLSDADKLALDKINTGAESNIKPIVRKPFPPSVLDRSPISGVSHSVVLRTCFRVGEAMATGCHGARNGHDIVIELYARVTASWREPAPGRKQHFSFKDIYHDKPPYLDGTFELWQQAQLWDLDSKVFTDASKGNGIMCRVIGRLKRDGQKWRLDVLSIWEATWEDIEFAAGICAVVAAA